MSPFRKAAGMQRASRVVKAALDRETKRAGLSQGLGAHILAEHADAYRAIIMSSGRELPASSPNTGIKNEELGRQRVSMRMPVDGIGSRRERLSGLGNFVRESRETWFSDRRKETPENFNKWIRILGVQGKALDVIAVLNEMEERGLKVSDYTLTAAAKACGDAEYLDGVREVARRLGSPSSVTRVVRTAVATALFRCGEREEALTFLTRSEAHQTNGHGLFLGEGFEDLSRFPDDGDVVMWTSVMKNYIDERKYSHAWKVLELMRIRGVEPDLVTLNILIACAAKSGETARAAALVEEMRLLGLHPDTVTYASLAHAYATAGDLAGTRAALGQAVESGLLMNQDMFCILMFAHAQVRDYRGAEATLQEIRERFPIHESILPAFSSLLTAYARTLHSEFSSLRRALPRHVESDELETKSNTAEEAKAMELDEVLNDRADAVMRELKEGGVALNTQTINTYLLVKAASCVPERLQEAMNVFVSAFPPTGSGVTATGMGVQGSGKEPKSLRPDQYTFSILVRAFGEQRNPNGALSVLRLMEQNYSLRPSAVVLLQAAHACCKGGLFDGALDLIRDARGRGIVLGPHTEPRVHQSLIALAAHFARADQRRILAVFYDILRLQHQVRLDAPNSPKYQSHRSPLRTGGP
uniref:Pentacotripeptide-repeat region of PRORP domain-containing protein n=1 Tax=Compsopogon caeruleus TaxID=31354 RepID=A0A6T6CP91_9RHOD|mmetsp:Transcript_6650/g.13480  ORF Transcript_6650/g.13480 Transcript_6650/m.13480 type:complete len:644 (+) Transcript_6650:1341-3272(+)